MTVHFSGCWEMAGMEGRGPDSRKRGLEPQGGDSGCEQRFKGQTVAADEEPWGVKGRMTQK